MTNLAAYYDYIQPLCVSLATKVISWTERHGSPCPEAQYLVQTAHRVLRSSYRLGAPGDAPPSVEDIEPVLTYIRLIEEHIQDFLEGEMTGSDIIRKGGKGLWERYHDQNILKAVYADGVAEAAAPYVAGKRVLELGGGVGATTRRLHAALMGTSEFVFSDVKLYFLKDIEKHLSDVPLVTTELDIDYPPDTLGQFDLIYATNTVHVATDIARSLTWMRHSLKEGGRVILGEGSPFSKHDPWPLDLLFAFFRGWWQVPVSEDRPFPGFLLPEQWLAFFARAGFSRFTAHILADERRTFGGVYVAQIAG